ncbi:MAG TPA: hypothetical protein VNN08_25540, partial [Thermoanaerobaculia bacterium]|nr:hypothetical protein [Thermoanaerobaculia bacterium]
PIIGRDRFRENVESMTAGGGPRVMVVWGPPGCGLQYSVKLLRRAVGTLTPIVEFSPRELARYAPPEFLRALVNGLGMTGLVSHPIPAPNPSEDFPRWLSRDLMEWLRDRLDDNAKRKQTQFPAWVVLNIATPPGERFLWADQLSELIAAVAGAQEPGQARIQIPHLRLLFLASSAEGIPIPGVNRLNEDLSNYVTARDDFIECLRRAWHSVDRVEPGQAAVLNHLAKLAIEGKPAAEHRKILSESVRAILLEHLQWRSE